MSLYNTYNSEDIISRAVIAGMLGILNDNIVYKQVWSNDNIELIKVPFYYNESGDERFMQDFYTHYAACNFPKKIDGNFDRIPRGTITYTGSSVDSARMTNRFVQGKYMKQVDGKLQSYVSFLYSIPLTINFDCEIWVDTQTTALKIEQEIREYFYKTKTFYVYYKGMRIGCTVGFPESVTINKLLQYSFETDNKIKLNFSLEAETYQPVFDPTTEMDANNYMKGLSYSIGNPDEFIQGSISIKTPITGAIIPKGIPLMIEWDYQKSGKEMKTVDIKYIDVESNQEYVIEKSVENNQYYYWNIPSTFTQYKQPTIIWEETVDIKIHNQPDIYIIPDKLTKAITNSSFNIINDGYFMTPTSDASISIILEMKDDLGRISYTGDNDIYINITNYKIDTSNPVWIDPSINLIFPGATDFRNINILVSNSTDNTISNTIENIDII